MYQPPKDQMRAVIKWMKPICVEKGRYSGYSASCLLANGGILTVFHQQPNLGEKPRLMAMC